MRGRKTLFKKEMMDEAIYLARYGLTIEQIAEFWGVSKRSLYRWLDKYPEFSHSLKKAKANADRNVENHLYKRAVGYEYVEETFERRGDKIVLVKRVKKHVIPDTTAQIFWLKNRQPERWRDRQQIDIQGEMKHKLVFRFGGNGKDAGD